MYPKTMRWLIYNSERGTRTSICATTASERRIEQFLCKAQKYGGVEVVERPWGVHWDGGELWEGEMRRLKRQYQKNHAR